MRKLYRLENQRVVAYHEAWADDDGAIHEHWGPLGDTGDTRLHEPAGGDPDAQIDAVLAPAMQRGFVEIPPDDHSVCVVEYAVQGFGTATDLDKRHALESHLDQALGWTGLGHCDGGSIGSGTMEVFCMVVDYEVAERILVEDLAETRFADFARIYQG